jgi:hypothetical protein
MVRNSLSSAGSPEEKRSKALKRGTTLFRLRDFESCFRAKHPDQRILCIIRDRRQELLHSLKDVPLGTAEEVEIFLKRLKLHQAVQAKAKERPDLYIEACHLIERGVRHRAWQIFEKDRIKAIARELNAMTEENAPTGTLEEFLRGRLDEDVELFEEEHRTRKPGGKRLRKGTQTRWSMISKILQKNGLHNQSIIDALLNHNNRSLTPLRVVLGGIVQPKPKPVLPSTEISKLRKQLSDARKRVSDCESSEYQDLCKHIAAIEKQLRELRWEPSGPRETKERSADARARGQLWALQGELMLRE